MPREWVEREKKKKERGWGRGEGTHQFVVFTWHPCLFPRTEQTELFSFCVIVIIGARCNMSPQAPPPLLTDAWAPGRACQRAT